MLFNSYIFIFIYLPITLVTYFVLNRKKYVIASKVWLSFASILFYAYWNVKYLPLLLGSIFFNYSIGTILSEGKIKSQQTKKHVLIFGIVCNLGLLCYYKYLNFLIDNISSISQLHLRSFELILPLGVSFFTFTQIAFLVDTCYKKSYELNFLNYILFVTFFPHLIAGPIIHHKEMMPQFDRLRNKLVTWKHLYQGLFLFSIGLLKKTAIADELSKLSISGFDNAIKLNFFESWVTSLSFTLQLYYDFSGYTDMALGTALMFNISLPNNFNIPYRACNIQDFWRRWHITLSRFLKDYIYIPLGGNKKGEIRTYSNLFITFLVGGIWHGAGWTFLFWGFLHGIATLIHRIWIKANLKMPDAVAWTITFLFLIISWVFFRAKTMDDASRILYGMIGLHGIVLPSTFEPYLRELKKYGVGFGAPLTNLGANYDQVLFLIISLILSIFFRNSVHISKNIKPNFQSDFFISVMFTYSILKFSKVSEFIYFNF